MKSTLSGLQVIPEGRDEQSSRILESSHSTEITKVENEQSLGMESSHIPTKIVQDEDDPLSGLESYHATTSSFLAHPEANLFMKDLLKANMDENAFQKHLNRLKKHLKDNLPMEIMFEFLDDNNMKGAQEKVEELFHLFDAIEFLIQRYYREILPSERSKVKAEYTRIDIYYHLFGYALRYKNKMAENACGEEKKINEADPTPTPLMSTIAMNLSDYYETTEFIVFLINKLRGEEDIMTSRLVPKETDGAKKSLITNCICMYEEETISIFIYHVLKDELKEADDLFKGLINPLKPSDLLNRGRLYNYALQRAEDLFEVHKFLMSGRLSQRYCNVVKDIDQMNWLAMESDNQVKVHKFLVDDLYLRDVEQMPEVMRRIDGAFVEKHDYPYLVKCVWIHRKIMLNIESIDAGRVNWTEVKNIIKYAFTSSAAIIVGGLDIMKYLLETWPELDANASYKSVTTLHIAAYTGNEKVVKYLLEQKELDVTVRTGRLLRTNNINLGKKQNQNRWNLSTHQTALHIATTQGHAQVVEILCNPPELHRQRMRCHEEDEEERTPLDILYAKDGYNLLWAMPNIMIL